MKQATRRVLSLLLSLCLLALPALSAADTYLPDGEVTHVDFTLATELHADGFPAGSAHYADWEAFLKKLDLRGSMDALALLTPTSRVYLNGALRLNGKDQIPFVYDGYHSYRYFISPALDNEVFFFQMHNFLEFMLKPYYYMALPTQYLGLLMYPEAAYYIGDSYYTPVADMLAAARDEAADEAANEAANKAAANREALLAQIADEAASLQTDINTATALANALQAALDANDSAALLAALKAAAPGGQVKQDADLTREGVIQLAALNSMLGEFGGLLATFTDAQANADALTDAQLTDVLVAAGCDVPAQDQEAEAAPYCSAEAAPDDQAEPQAESGAQAAPEGATVYTVPYENLYELCEGLDLVENDDSELERVYFFFTSLLTEQYASDMVLDTLGRLEDVLDYLDPDQNGMTVTQTDTSLSCVLGETEVFRKSSEAGVTDIAFALPTADGYDFTFTCHWDANGTGAALQAKAAIVMDGEDNVALTVDGTGLPRTGDVSGNGQITLTASGSSFQTAPAPFTLAFDWAKDAKEKPYRLGLTLDWLNPVTGKRAVTVRFTGAFTTVDRSVFVEGSYPQNDFFNLNESFLDEYKARLLKPLMLKLLPIVLETPSGVINDLYSFAQQNDILVSLVE